MYVCSCRGVSDRTVSQAIDEGAGDVGAVAARCGAGGRCGGCIPLIEELLAEAGVSLPARRSVAA